MIQGHKYVKQHSIYRLISKLTTNIDFDIYFDMCATCVCVEKKTTIFLFHSRDDKIKCKLNMSFTVNYNIGKLNSVSYTNSTP